MTGISVDVVGLNIVVYASTGITLPFRVLTSSSRVVFFFFCFLSICQARSLFCTFPVKSVRQQLRWWFEMRFYLHIHVFKQVLLSFMSGTTENRAQPDLRDFGHERHVRYASEGPYIFTCTYLVVCCVRRQNSKFRFTRVCIASSGTMCSS